MGVERAGVGTNGDRPIDAASRQFEHVAGHDKLAADEAGHRTRRIIGETIEEVGRQGAERIDGTRCYAGLEGGRVEATSRLGFGFGAIVVAVEGPAVVADEAVQNSGCFELEGVDRPRERLRLIEIAVKLGVVGKRREGGAGRDVQQQARQAKEAFTG